MKRYSIILIVLLTGVFALAGGMENSEKPQFNVLDLDKDGFISLTEAEEMPALAQVFASLDQDLDQKLNEEEYKAFKKDQ